MTGAMKTVVHLTSSRFFGGPERQMLGLARHLPSEYRTLFVSFCEGGRAGAFLEVVRERGFEARSLVHDTPHLLAVYKEIGGILRQLTPDVLCCHGYKASIIGGFAANQLNIPVVGVSRGWTAESMKVRVYEWLDRKNLRRLDHIVCVSQGQADKVRRSGVAADRVSVIHNAIDVNRFSAPNPADRTLLAAKFNRPIRHIIGSAGRLSPEKGFSVLINAAARVVSEDPSAGFILFGDGPLRGELQAQIAELGLNEHFLLAGFEANFDRWLPHLDLFVNPSYTEGLANVILESLAAKVPVIATAVGGTPEIIEHGVTGYLVEAGDATQIAQGILSLLAPQNNGKSLSSAGYCRVLEQFGFERQSVEYLRLFGRLTNSHDTRQEDIIRNAHSGLLSH